VLINNRRVVRQRQKREVDYIRAYGEYVGPACQEGGRFTSRRGRKEVIKGWIESCGGPDKAVVKHDDLE